MSDAKTSTIPYSDIANILGRQELDGRARKQWIAKLEEVTPTDVEWALSKRPGNYSLEKALIFVSPAAENYLEQMASSARQITLQRFGKIIHLFAPLYLSNYCVNGCVYCGFNQSNRFSRIRLTIEQALAEAEIIAQGGFKDLLLVSSEDEKFISVDYLARLASKLRPKFSSLSVEIPRMSTAGYETLFAAGIEGVTLFQETYDRERYRLFHLSGPKADYDQRLSAPDNIAQAGMREIGIGALLGLSDWRLETLALAEHAHYLIQRYWKSRVSLSFPRMRPAQNVDRSQFVFLSDENLVQMILALRLCFPDAGFTISTREPAQLRDHLVHLGITRMSAGSKTNPGGYTGQTCSVEQFEIDDNRTPAQIAESLRAHDLEPVWKDWDPVYSS